MKQHSTYSHVHCLDSTNVDLTTALNKQLSLICCCL